MASLRAQALVEELTQFRLTGVAIDADDRQERLACAVTVRQNDLSRVLAPSADGRHHFERRILFVRDGGGQQTNLLEREPCARFCLTNTRHTPFIPAKPRPITFVRSATSNSERASPTPAETRALTTRLTVSYNLP